VIWLLRHLKPDFKTIADIHRDNRNAFRAVFRQFRSVSRMENEAVLDRMAVRWRSARASSIDAGTRSSVYSLIKRFYRVSVCRTVPRARVRRGHTSMWPRVAPYRPSAFSPCSASPAPVGSWRSQSGVLPASSLLSSASDCGTSCCVSRPGGARLLERWWRAAGSSQSWLRR
jgi:hypothetical protein